MKQDTLKRLLEDQAAKKAVALATDMDSGAQTLIYLDTASGPDAEDAEILSVTRQSIQDDRSKVYEIDGRRIFVEVFNPPLRMIVVGAVHITQVLVPMSVLAGYQVIVVDPRQAWATADRFPGVNLTTEWPEDALSQLDLDRRCAVVMGAGHEEGLARELRAAATRAGLGSIGIVTVAPYNFD